MSDKSKTNQSGGWFSSGKRERRVLRGVSWATSAALAWMGIGPALGAAVNKETQRPGHTRALSAVEMTRIVGGQFSKGGGGEPPPIGEAHILSVAEDSGTTYPWEGSVGGANTVR